MKPTQELINQALKPSDHTNYAEKAANEIQIVEDLIRRTSRLKEIRFASWGQELVDHLVQLAKCYVMLKDIPEARREFGNAARLSFELTRINKEKKFSRLSQFDKPANFDQAFILGFPEAILSDDELILRMFAQNLDETEAVMTGRKFCHHITSAMKFLVLGNMDKAKYYALLSHKLEYLRLPFKGFSHAILGIIERDMFLVNEGIAMRMKAHKVKEYNTPFWEFSHEATALAKLAIRAGLNPTVQSPFLAQRLLLPGEKESDDKVDRILEALKIANERKGNAMWSILRIFSGVR